MNRVTLFCDLMFWRLMLLLSIESIKNTQIYVFYSELQAIHVTYIRRLTGGLAKRYRHSSPIYKNRVALCFLQIFQKFEAENFLHSIMEAPEKYYIFLFVW